MATTRLLVDGLGDLGPIAHWPLTNMQMVASGVASIGQITVRDIGQYPTDFVTGKRVTVDRGAGTDPIWTGYLVRANRRFWFSVDNPTTMNRQWVLTLVDINILFQKRVVFKVSDPAVIEGPTYTANTYDDDVIDELVTNWLDLSADDIDTSSRVDRVAYANVGQAFYPINGGMRWGDVMSIISWLPAAVWYLDPDRALVYADVDGVDAPFSLADDYRTPASSFSDDFDRSVGPGTGSLGGPWVWHRDDALVSDPADDNVYVDGSAVILPAHPTGRPTEQNYSSWRWGPRPAAGTAKFDFWVPSLAAMDSFYPTYGINLDDPAIPVYIYVWAHDTGGSWRLGTSAWNTSAVADYTFTPTPSSWYTAELIFDASQNVEMRVWPQGGSRPSSPNTSGSMSGVGAPDDNGVPFLDLYFSPFDEDGKIDNFSVVGLPPVPTESGVGYREMTIIDDGAQLANDVAGWGFGKGEAHGVFSRQTDADSIALHGLWQDSFVAYDVWKQATIDKVVGSSVFGSPSSKRGHKDDRFEVDLVTYEHGFRVGQKARFISRIYDIDTVLPIRDMTLKFEGPEIIRYEMKLSHEIDPRRTLADPLPKINIGTVRVHVPKYKPPKYDQPHDGDCECGQTDTFDRPDSVDPGVSDAQIPWEIAIGPGTGILHEISGGQLHLLNGDYGSDPAYPTYYPPIAVTLDVGDSTEAGSVIWTPINASGSPYMDFILPHQSSFDFEDQPGIGINHLVRIVRGAHITNGTFTVVPGTSYNVKWIDTVASTSMKIWAVGDPEPGSWLLTDSTPTVVTGLFGFNHHLGVVQTESYFSDLSLVGVDRCGAVQFDTFDRTVSQDIGFSTPSNLPWSLYAGSGTFGVNGDYAYVLPSGSVKATTTTPIVSGPFTAHAIISASSLGGSHHFILSVGDPSGDAIDVWVDIDNSGGGLAVEDNVAGGHSDGIAITTFDTSKYHVKWEVTGSLHRAKIWVVGAAEPGWQVSLPLPSWTPTNLFFYLDAGGGGAMQLYSLDFGYVGRPCYGDCSTPPVTLDDFSNRNLSYQDPVSTDTGTPSGGGSWATDYSTSGVAHQVDSGIWLIRNHGIYLSGFPQIQQFGQVLTPTVEYHLTAIPNRVRMKFRSNLGTADVSSFSAHSSTWGPHRSVYLVMGSHVLEAVVWWGAPSSGAPATPSNIIYHTISGSDIVVPIDPILANTWYWLELEGTYPTHIRGRIYLDGSEPNTWQIDTTNAGGIPLAALPLSLEVETYTGPVPLGIDWDVEIDTIEYLPPCSDVAPPVVPGVPISGEVTENLIITSPEFFVGAVYLLGTPEIWVTGRLQFPGSYTEDPVNKKITLAIDIFGPTSVKIKYTVA